MRNNKLTLKPKGRIVEEGNSSRNIRTTARKYRVQPTQIRKWRENYSKIKELGILKPNNVTIHSGTNPYNQELGDKVYNWVAA